MEELSIDVEIVDESNGLSRPIKGSVLALQREAEHVQLYCEQRLKGILSGNSKKRLNDTHQDDWTVDTSQSGKENEISLSDIGISVTSLLPSITSHVAIRTETHLSSITVLVVQRPIMSTNRTQKKIGDKNQTEENKDLDVDEIDGYILNDEEKDKRLAIRDKLYGEFMAERARKKKEKAGKKERAAASGIIRKKWTRRDNGLKGSQQLHGLFISDNIYSKK